MLVRIEFKTDTPANEVINLCDYGYEIYTKWEDLTEDEQNEITDSLVEQYCVYAGGEDMDFNDNFSDYEDTYNEYELEQITTSL